MPCRAHPGPAAAQVHAALLRWLTGDPSADIRLASHPLPVLAQEVAVRIGEAAGKGSMLGCTTTRSPGPCGPVRRTR